MARSGMARGVYALTDTALCADDFAGRIAAAVAGGVTAIQYRDKSEDEQRRRAEVETLLRLARPAGVRVIVNDDVALARRTGADGVHLGRDDAAIADARAALGGEALVGVSCYDSAARARVAVAAGADYVAFGRFYPSSTKPDAVQAPIDLLRAVAPLPVPIVAIGGIDASNGGALVRAGADLLAVVHAVFGAADVTLAARRLAALFTTRKTLPDLTGDRA